MAFKGCLNIVGIFGIVIGLSALQSSANGEDLSCQTLVQLDFSLVPDAPTQITNTQTISESFPWPQYCRIEVYISANVGFEIAFRNKVGTANSLCRAVVNSAADMQLSPNVTSRSLVAMPVSLPISATKVRRSMASGRTTIPKVRLTSITGPRTQRCRLQRPLCRRRWDAVSSNPIFGDAPPAAGRALFQRNGFHKTSTALFASAPAGVSPGGEPHLMWSASTNLDEDGNPILPVSKLLLLHDAVLAACDGLDGLEDGLIDDPRRCEFDPADMQCRRRPRDDCFTGPEVAAIRRIYDGATDSEGISL